MIEILEGDAGIVALEDMPGGFLTIVVLYFGNMVFWVIYSKKDVEILRMCWRKQ